MTARGAVAAGHPVTAEAATAVLRDGGNAVDAAVAAMLASFTAEPLLTGLGAGGYMLVVAPGEEPVLLDFSVEAPGRGAGPPDPTELLRVDVSFGDAVQVFYAGAASCAAYGTPAGICEAMRRFGSRPLSELAGPAAALAREGVALNAQQAYVVEILAAIILSTPECAALYAPGGRLLREGDVYRNPDLAGALERLGEEGSAPFHSGDIAAKISSWIRDRGGALSAEDLAAYEVVGRPPVRAVFRGRDVLLNPPPSAGGTLIAFALALLDRDAEPPTLHRLIEVMEAAQAERTPQFLAGLAEEGFLERFRSSRLGSTTHISVLDAEGRACAVTCSNGEGSGLVVPGTGIHVNNMMGEQDLNPLGFHRHPAGRRLPSMMSPTVALWDGTPEIVLGSGGSNRIRSAIVQTVVNMVDRGMAAGEAVLAPRIHVEDGMLFAEPGIEVEAVEAAGATVSRFRDLNLFFGGVHAVRRDPATGELSAGGDPRRGGATALV